MNAKLNNALAVAGLIFATQAAAQVTFYENEDFAGKSFTTQRQVVNFARYGFNDRASSVVVARNRWEVCEDASFGGRCVVLRPGRYASLASMGLNDRMSSVRPVSASARIDDKRFAPAPVVAQVTLYESEDFGGRSFTTTKQIGNFKRSGFKDRASSIVVLGDPWEACESTWFTGRCVVLRPGKYPTLMSMGLKDPITSVRTGNSNARSGKDRYTPAPAAVRN